MICVKEIVDIADFIDDSRKCVKEIVDTADFVDDSRKCVKEIVDTADFVDDSRKCVKEIIDTADFIDYSHLLDCLLTMLVSSACQSSSVKHARVPYMPRVISVRTPHLIQLPDSPIADPVNCVPRPSVTV